MAKGAGKARKKIPKALAVVNADNCTGCEACIEVCPVDCIYKVSGEELPTLQTFVDIDLERCIGCDLCERWCPWDAIEMIVPTETPRDVPIEFVPVGSADWAKLPKFWNQAVPLEGGMRTIHLGQLPVQAAAAMVAADQLETIRIKVPLGLPDPRPFVPGSN